jgi:Na+-driven multidrug efflux pump
VTIAPQLWLGAFTADVDVLAAGTAYLRLVGPTYVLFGLGLSLYFASQGAGRLLWPLVGGLVRLVVAAGGGWIAIHWLGAGIFGIFVATATSFALYGIIVGLAVRLGSWGPALRPAAVRPGAGLNV